MSPRVGAALAHANIAFSKYWGKRPYAGNYPATPSISMTVGALTTRTRVRFDDALGDDRVVIDGREAHGAARARVSALLDRLRAAAKTGAFADVFTRSDFPAAAGLASSASGFAALALAAARALDLPRDPAAISDLARRSSASAARSLYGGFVELPAGPPEATDAPLPARQVEAEGAVDWRLVIAVAGEGPKAVGSTDGMETTRATSPFYASWLAMAPGVHAELLDALARRDLPRFGAAAEQSALAMHASALAAGVVYFRGVTLDALSAVRALRARGVSVFATVDAGPHVKALCREADAKAVAAALGEVTGVTRVIESRQAGGARLIDPEEVT